MDRKNRSWTLERKVALPNTTPQTARQTRGWGLTVDNRPKPAIGSRGVDIQSEESFRRDTRRVPQICETGTEEQERWRERVQGCFLSPVRKDATLCRASASESHKIPSVMWAGAIHMPADPR